MKKAPKRGALKKSKLQKKLWTVFSEYIKKRDTDWRGYGKCISCGEIMSLEQKGSCHAGHFDHGKSKENYYSEDNVYLQCRRCNFYGGARVLQTFTINLVRLIGIDRVEQLKNSRSKYWSYGDLEERLEYYTEKISKL